MRVGGHLQLPARRHGLAAIQYQVQQRLFHQVRVQAESRYGTIRFENELNIILGSLRFGEREYFPHQCRQFYLHEVKFYGPGKVKEGLDDAIQTPKFRG